ncbi:MAG: hypothetical protein V1722_05715 [Candidatus Micrarchaeota archaeon]
MNKIEARAFFNSRRYRTPVDVLSDAEVISQQMRLHPVVEKLPKPEKPLSTLQAKALRATRRGQWSLEQIARQHLKASGKVNGTRPSATQLSHMVVLVHQAMAQLRAKGLIKKVPLLELPKLRDVTSADIKKHLGLVHHVLNRGHRFLVPGWQRFFDHDTAASFGMTGLLRALETYDPKRDCKFSRHAGNYIAAAVNEAVRREMGRGEVSLDELDETGRSLYNDLPVLPVGTDFLEPSPIALLLRHPRHTARELLYLTLHDIYGYSIGDIGRHFDVSREMINVFRHRAMRKVQEVQRDRENVK